MKNVFRRVSTCLLCVTCLSAGIILPTTHMNIVFAQETQQQKDLYQVTTTKITKNKGESVNKFEILNAVQTTAFGQVPVIKSVLKEYEQRLPLMIKNDGDYNFPVQVQYPDGSITEVTVSVVTPNNATTGKEQESELVTEKQKLTVALNDLLILIQENPNTFPYTEESKTVYANAVSNAYEPYKEGKAIVNSSNATLEEIKKALADVETQKTAIISAKEGFVERQATAEEVNRYNTLLSQLETALKTAVKTSDKAPTSISTYEEVKDRAQSLLDKAKKMSLGNVLFNNLLEMFKEVEAMKKELIIAQNTLMKSTSQAQQYNPKGKEVTVSIGDPIQPLDFIQNAEAIDQLPQGTTVKWTYGKPMTDVEYDKAPISITFTYPDGSTDIVSAALTVIPQKDPENSNSAGIHKEPLNGNIGDTSKLMDKKDERQLEQKTDVTPRVAKAVQKISEDKQENKKLPKTGESEQYVLMLGGSFLLLLSFIGLIFKNKYL
ncbi:Rib/alpha-like domain-containing protein [Enterococcus gallinarum]|uniref:Rib/alpha-like domain-containing protein n=2 Tax=Enterococcus gallinarum TaxID=1353 RepID=UPI001F57EF4F|nr:Rib/alpha-like domain-containing protein [Enterococcus gallinarum]MCR1932758.1 Rib/alpha-like domain-containing protein [Enterococcus gallinarum]MDV7824464.1 Rib/alpha-like domain-containing protein [Enterococcus gallinarum]GMG59806.1 hypothetical protein AH4_31660 [Enterococcus gallinarum]